MRLGLLALWLAGAVFAPADAALAARVSAPPGRVSQQAVVAEFDTRPRDREIVVQLPGA